MLDLEYFFSKEFDEKKFITTEELWTLSCLIEKTMPNNTNFDDIFILRSDDGTEYLNWNGKPKEIVFDLMDDRRSVFVL